jgi:hypothetical protein
MPNSPENIQVTPGFTWLLKHSQAQSSPSLDAPEHYHWKGLLLQSFEFIAAENTYRLLSDGGFRHLTADKPYWHDYIASLHQWNMRRWNDGDDFLVDEIGHPMQGAVSSFIEIQNDPRQRNLRIGRSKEYWHSRFKALLWATAYSTQQKVGPLGEAALGSDGGETYVPGCAFPCPSYIPGKTKYTNNTGWTDFIATPVIGELWVLFEDSIDRYISDPLEERHPRSYFPKIVRGALNPTRTAANLARGKSPWYRDFQQVNAAAPPAVHFLREDPGQNAPRWELFPHFSALSLPVNEPNCSPCRSITTGIGLGASYRIARWLDLDADLNRQPNASPLPSDRAGGNAILGTFGIRSGIQTRNYALKVALRPGFLSYSRAYLTSPSGYHLISTTGPVVIPPAPGPPQIGRITHFATALAISGDYGLSHHLALRAVVGNTPVRYKTDYLDRLPGLGQPPYLYFISANIFATNENWTYQAGPVLKF